MAEKGSGLWHCGPRLPPVAALLLLALMSSVQVHAAEEVCPLTIVFVSRNGTASGSLLMDVNFTCSSFPIVANCSVIYCPVVGTTSVPCLPAQAKAVPVSPEDCSRGFVSGLEISGLDTRNQYTVTATSFVEGGPTFSVQAMGFPDCGTQSSCSVKRNSNVNCYTSSQRCDVSTQCTAFGDRADERGCIDLTVNIPTPSAAPAGSSIRFVCNSTASSTRYSLFPRWSFRAPCPIADCDSPVQVRSGSNGWLTENFDYRLLNGGRYATASMTILNFTMAQVGTYFCSDGNEQVDVNISISGVSTASECAMPVSPFLSVTPQRLYYQNRETVMYGCPFPLLGSGARHSDCSGAAGMWNPPPPVCQEPPHLTIPYVNYARGSTIAFTCQIVLPNLFTYSASSRIVTSSNVLITTLTREREVPSKRNVQPVTQGTRYFGDAVASLTGGYICQFNVTRPADAFNVAQNFLLATLPVPLTVFGTYVSLEVRPARVIRYNPVTLMCDTAEILTVQTVFLWRDGIPFAILYRANISALLGQDSSPGPQNNAILDGNILSYTIANVSSGHLYECRVDRLSSFPLTQQDSTMLELVTAPNGTIMSVQAVRGLSRSAYNVTLQLTDTGGSPVTCLISVVNANFPLAAQKFPCPEVASTFSYITTTVLGENLDYNVSVILENAAGRTVLPYGILVSGCMGSRLSCRNSAVCYNLDDICDGISTCSSFDDEIGCGSLSTPVSEVTAAGGSQVTIPCTFVTSSRLSTKLSSANGVALDTSRFVPQWTTNAPREGCSPVNFPLVNTRRRLPNGSYELTATFNYTSSSTSCNPFAIRCTVGAASEEGLPSYTRNLRYIELEGTFCSESQIPTPGNGTKFPISLPDYVPGDDGGVMFSCDPGFILRGLSRLACLLMGQWTGLPPSCEYDRQLSPVAIIPQGTAIATMNFTMSFIINNTMFPVDASSIVVTVTDGRNVPTVVNQSRYTIAEVDSSDNQSVVYSITLTRVQPTDVGLYSVALQRTGVSLTITQAISSLATVITCSSTDIVSNMECVADQDSDQQPDSTDRCPLDATNRCTSNVQCPQGTDPVWGLLWNPVYGGALAAEPCPANSFASATRPCSNSGVWGTADLSNCGTAALLEFAADVQTSEGVLLLLPEAETNADRLSNLTSTDLYPADLTATLSVLLILYRQQVTRRSLGIDVTSDAYRQAFVEVASNLVDDVNFRAWRSLETVGSETESQDLLSLIEDFATIESAEQPDNVSEEVRSNTSTPNLDMIFVSLTSPQASQIVFSSLEFNTSETVLLPLEVFQSGATRYAATSFNGIGPLLRPSTQIIVGETLESNSRILTILVTASNGSRLTTRDLNNPITMTLRHFNNTRLRNPTCAFYDFGFLRGVGVSTGGWGIDGLERNDSASNEAAEGVTVCHTVHLTSFSVLVSQTTSNVNSVALRFISYIGCGISLVCLLIVAFIFIYFKSLHNDHNAIHCNLAISLGLGQLLFLVGIERTENEDVCTGFAIVLHYFFVVAFMWMLMEGLQIYFMLVQVFPSTTKRLRYYYMAAYGIPVVIVAITAGVNIKDYGTSTYCWIDISSNTRWAFHGPVIAVILANLVFLLLALRVLYRRTQKKGSDYEAVKASFKGSVVILPLLGITWAVGLLAVNENTLVFHYLFVIFNSLQGLFIFIMHCVRNPQVKRAISTRYKRYKVHKKEMSDLASTGKSTSELKKMQSQSRIGVTTSDVGTISTNAPHSRKSSQVPEPLSMDHLSEDNGISEVESAQPRSNAPTSLSFGKQQETIMGKSPPAPTSQIPMSVVAMQLADAGPDLESSDEEEASHPNTPMITETKAKSPFQPPAAIPSSGSESSLPGAPVRVVGQRQSAVDDDEGAGQRTATSPPASTSETFGSFTSSTFAQQASSPTGALPLMDDILSSLRSTGQSGQSAESGGGGVGQEFASLASAEAQQTEEAKLSRRDWRDVTVTKDIRTRVQTKVEHGEFGGSETESVDNTTSAQV